MASVESDRIMVEVAGLRRETGLLTAAIAQVVATLDMQGTLLRALLEAVTAPADEGSGLADALARIAGALEEQTAQLAAIHQGLAVLGGSGAQRPR